MLAVAKAARIPWSVMTSYKMSACASRAGLWLGYFGSGVFTFHTQSMRPYTRICSECSTLDALRATYLYLWLAGLWFGYFGIGHRDVAWKWYKLSTVNPAAI